MKFNPHKAILFWGVIMITGSCIDEIELPLESGGMDLAINGHITNRAEPYLVTINQHGTYGKVVTQQSGISNAMVAIKSASGEQTILKEISPGNYVTDSTNFRGKIGKQYRLDIQLEDGRKYLSNFEPLLPVPPIRGLNYFFYEEKFLNESEIIASQKKIDVLVDTQVPLDGSSAFFKWNVRGEYEFRELEALTDIFAYTGVGPTMFTCFIQDDIRLGEIIIHNASDLPGSLLEAFPVKSIEVDYKFAFNYCVHVDQWSLSASAYHYLQSAAQTLDRNGTILEESIGKLRGNIFNVLDDKERVHGFFYASAITESKMFVPRDSVDRPISSCLLPDPLFDEVCRECVEIKNSTRNRPAYWPN